MPTFVQAPLCCGHSEHSPHHSSEHIPHHPYSSYGKTMSQRIRATQLACLSSTKTAQTPSRKVHFPERPPPAQSEIWPSVQDQVCAKHSGEQKLFLLGIKGVVVANGDTCSWLKDICSKQMSLLFPTTSKHHLTMLPSKAES